MIAQIFIGSNLRGYGNNRQNIEFPNIVQISVAIDQGGAKRKEPLLNVKERFFQP
jgi:hypothetical protein